MSADPTVVPPAELVAALKVALAEAVVSEPISVGAEEAARMVGCCSKTLASLPAAEVGRFKLNRRTLYELTTLRATSASLWRAK